MNKKQKLHLNISEGALLSLVADKLKNRILFPKKLENAKKN